MFHAARTRSGFTLIELSIVLVIIGLIVGGILAGTSLISAARVRKVASEIEGIRTASMTYGAKYNCIPGDCPNATQFWGTQASCPPAYSATPTQLTCNGDGDRIVSSITSNRQEKHYFFQQLGNANLISGSYTGTPGSTGADDTIRGVNTLASSFSQGAYLLHGYYQYLPTDVTFYGGIYWKHMLILGRKRNQANEGHDWGIMTPMENYALDSKIDDGRAGYGTISARHSSAFCDDGACNCSTNTSDPVTALYNVSVNTAECTVNVSLDL